MTAAGQRMTQSTARFSLGALAQGFRERTWLAYGAYTLFTGSVLLAATARGIVGLKPGDLLLGGMVGLLVLRRILRRDYSFAVTPVDVAFGLLIIAGTVLPLLKAVIEGLYLSKEMLNALAGPIEYFLMYRVVLEALALPSKLPTMTRVILVVVSLISIIGVLQIAKFPGVEDFLLTFFPTYETAESPVIHRATSLVGGWEILAAISAYIVLLINQIQTTDEGVKTLGRRWNWILIGFLAFNVVALLSTLSTAGFLAIVLGYVVAWRLNGKLARTTLYAMGVAVVGAIALTPVIIERLQYQFGKAAAGAGNTSAVPNTWVARWTHWDVVFQTVLLHPASLIFGVRPNFDYPVLAFGSTESLYLLLLYRGGLIYVAAFIAFIVIVMRRIWQIRQKVNGFNRHVVTAIFTILTVNFVIDILDAHFFSAGEWQILMTLIAIAVGLDLRTDNFEEPPARTDEAAPTAMRIPAVRLASSWDARFRMGLAGALASLVVIGGVGLFRERHQLPPPAVLSIAYYNATAPTSAENQNFGTDAWQLDSGVDTTFIQGYAGMASALRGQAVPLYISTKRKVAYDIQVYRIGWYRGLGGRLMQTIHIDADHAQVQGTWSAKGGLQNCASCDDASLGTHLLDAHWQASTTLTIGSDWTTGVYLVKLVANTDTPQAESYIPLVVRSDDSNSDFLVSLPVNTYQAYNTWGGYSLYSHVTSAAEVPDDEGGKNFDERARQVSFNRPYAQAAGSGSFLDWDIHTIRWLERSGYDVSYTTNVDVAARPEALLHHAAYISAGHDEYWTLAMRDGLERARAAGVSLAFLGANDGYWQGRLENDATGTPDRTLTCYKVMTLKTKGSDATTDPSLDPFYGDKINKTKQRQVTTLWRDPILNRPENALLGLMYASYFKPNPNNRYLPEWQVRDGDPDVSEKAAKLSQGQKLPGGALGYEFDTLHANGQTPPNLVILSESQVVDYHGYIFTASSAYYRDLSGAIVFDAGSIWWSYALDEFNFPGSDQQNYMRGNHALELMTTTILRMMLGAAHVPPPNTVSVDAAQ